MTGLGDSVYREELWLGFTVGDLHQLATRAAILCRWADRFPYSERFEIAWAGFTQVVTGQRASPDTMTIHPGAMPAGAELSFGYFKLSSGQETVDTLIDTGSYTCTSTAPVVWPGKGHKVVVHGDIVATITTGRTGP
jgi:hypothetical protein